LGRISGGGESAKREERKPLMSGNLAELR
jgi:hypothetical protein